MPAGGPSAALSLLLTCEHGGNAIPEALRPLFKDAGPDLQGHRGWDPGALDLYHRLQPLADASYAGTTSRLVVELNRSLDHPDLFSSHTRDLSDAEKGTLLDTCYFPFRKAVLDRVQQWIGEDRQVLHVSVHSFTPELNGERRDFHIGLLFDPDHGSEAALARQWRSALLKGAPDLDVRYNEPYLGTDDGHTLALRKAFGPRYSGIELEVRNDLLSTAAQVQEMGGLLSGTLRMLLEGGREV